MQLIVGQIARPHGIRGEVVVEIRTDEPGQRFTAGTVLATDRPTDRSGTPRAGGSVGGAAGTSAGTAGVPWQLPPALTIETVRPHLGRLIIGFEGVMDRDVADELRGVLLCVDSADVAPAADPDEFNDFELVGLRAVDQDGVTIGTVQRIDHAPASDLLVLRLPEGGTALVPFVKAIVPRVDLAAGVVVLDPPGGLFDL